MTVSPLFVSPAHRAELHDSGLSDETIALARIETISDQHIVHNHLNWEPPKRWSKNSLGDCMAFPCFAPEVSEPFGYTLKPTFPRVDKKRKKNGEPKFRKYEAPRDAPPLVYLPPRSRARLNSAATKHWTEGPKKGLLLDQLGFTTIALTGVWNGHCSATHRESGEFRFHPLIEKHVQIRDCHHVICFDSDARTNDHVKMAVNTLARMLLDAGALSVKLALPPNGMSEEKIGIDDYYVLFERRGQSGAVAVSELFESARPIVDPDPLDVRPRVYVRTEEHEVVAEVVELLAGGSSELFSRNSQLVRINRHDHARKDLRNVRRAAGAPTIAPLPSAALRTMITREICLVKAADDDGNVDFVHPPSWLVDGVATAGHWKGIRELAGVSDCPVILPDGSIIAASGYDESTGLFLTLPPDLEGLDVEEHPSRDLCASAAECLKRLVSEVPFESQEGRAAWLAGVLSAFARAAINGPVPMYFLVAATPGTGKGLCVQVASVIATGRDAGTTGYVQDAVEMTKRYASVALAGDRILWLDDVSGNFGDSATNRTLTSPILSERLLGTNTKPALVFDAVPWATGNNVQIEGDTRRRVIPIRLISTVERPEERSGFRHPDLIAHVTAKRAKYVKAALTLLRGFILAGRPTLGLGVMGSYNAWRDLVAGAVFWATGVDPIASRKVLSAATDPRLDALRAFLRGLQAMNAETAEKALLARTIVERLHLNAPDWDIPEKLAAARNALDALGDTKPGAQITPRVLGMLLVPLVERAVALDGDGKKLVRLRSKLYQGTHYWWAETLAGSRTDASGTEGSNGTSTIADPREGEGKEISRATVNRSGRGPIGASGPTIGALGRSFPAVDSLFAEGPQNTNAVPSVGGEDPAREVDMESDDEDAITSSKGAAQ